jgi:uncharacterized protein
MLRPSPPILRRVFHVACAAPLLAIACGPATPPENPKQAGTSAPASTPATTIASAAPPSKPEVCADGDEKTCAAACEKGSAESCAKLGAALEAATANGSFDRRAPDAYQKACEGGVMSACRRLGKLSAIAPPALAKAWGNPVTWLERACTGKDGEACAEMAAISAKRKESAKAESYLAAACDSGHAPSCTTRAWRLSSQTSAAAADVTALFERACTLGDGAGCYHLARRVMGAEGAPKDAERAVKLLDQACRVSFGDACSELGEFFASGKGVAKDPSQAASLFQRGCDASSGAGCNALALAYEKGDGVAKDATKVRPLLERGCEGGSARACVRLGDDSKAVRGAAKDQGKALEYYDKGCTLRDGPACEKAARMLLALPAGPESQNKSLACQRFDKACNLGVSSLMCVLGQRRHQESLERTRAKWYLARL